LAPTIRPEQPDDLAAIREVNLQAFARDGQAGTGEADLVNALRSNGKSRLSLVAELDGLVIGHVMFSDVTVASPSATHTILGLAPLAVLPEYQKQGVGSALMHASIDECRRMGAKAIFLLGHPSYYPRFGFAPARLRDMLYQNGRDSAMVLELVPGGLEGVTGTVSFESEFDAFE